MAHIQPEHIELDALLQQRANRGPIPADAELACVHEVNFMLDVAEETLWFRRLPICDELWVEGDRPGRVARMMVIQSKEDAASAMLYALMAARHGREVMAGCLTEGLIGRERYRQIDTYLQHQVSDNERRASGQAEAIVVATARRLELNPRPTGHAEYQWRCRCPWEKAHYLLLDTRSNRFECGWCRVEGSAEALEQTATPPLNA